jgi:serine/threonine-protein kinase
MPASSEAGTVAMNADSFSRTSRTSVTAPERFTPGAVLAQRYRIAGCLGKGGMGEVYRAHDLILDQDVALKFLPAGFASSAAALDRFRNEVRLARTVSHPNVCRVYDIGEIEGAPFLTMEYVDGEDLASLLRRIGRLPADKALDFARSLCAGLAAAHEKGVLHCDLKPANVMIDGRGEVRINDFGLAALAGSVDEAAARQGTPAYQAPEQLAGREVTVKSDLYALGLVLYEMFTGKRAFEARSLDELARMQKEAPGATIASIAKDVDPAVDRAILQCLAADPRYRPPSAKALAASLPRGDPLAAAIAAGETPSPAMVALAGEGMRPAVAIGLLAATLAGLLAVAAIETYTAFPQKTPFENSPETLTATARDLVKRLGYTARPADSASGIEYSQDYLHYAQKHYPFKRIQAYLAAARPAPIEVWYRQSPLAMNPRSELFVTTDYPGFSVPGMVQLRLDMEGRLLLFEARPEEHETRTASPPDWKPLFDAAKLDLARFQSAAPEWAPSAAFDASTAWTGTLPDAPEIPIRIEAAAWRGKPVQFRLIGPWTEPAHPPAADAIQIVWLLVAFLVFLPIAIAVARRNLRLKRGDRAGASRLTVVTFLISMTGAVIGMHYFWTPEMGLRLFHQGCIAFGAGSFVGVAYLAVEPFVRRRCPRILISWARLLQNGPRDPVVGAEVLAGLAAGVGIEVLVQIQKTAQLSLAHRIDSLFTSKLFILSVGHFLGSLFAMCWVALFASMAVVFFFFLLRLALRRDWLAAATLALLMTIPSVLTSGYPALQIPFALATYSVYCFVLLRFGLLGLAALLLVSAERWATPWTLDPSRWYFGYSVTQMLLLAALAFWSVHTALAGRKLLGDESLG